MPDSELIERLAAALIGAVPNLDPGEQTVALALLRTLAKGEPVSEQALAAASGAPEPTIREALGSWPGVFRDEDGRVVGFMGPSVAEFGEHRIELGGRMLTAWCAWDTLFLPELLGGAARVRSRCPVTSKQISLTVGPDGPSDARPSGTVLSFLAPERPFDANVVRSFSTSCTSSRPSKRQRNGPGGTPAPSRSRSSRASAWARGPSTRHSELHWVARTSRPDLAASGRD